MLRKITKEQIKYFFLILDVFITLLAVYLIYNGQFSFDVLKRAAIILIFFSLYRYIGEFLDLPYYRTLKHRSLESYLKDLNELSSYKNSKNRSNLMKDYIRKLILFVYDRPKYRILLDVVFIIPFLNPFMWHHLLIWWIWNKWYYVKVFINGNKDIFFKRYFGIDSTRWFVDENERSFLFTRIINYVILFPFFRVIMFPSYVKEKILQKEWFDFFKARFFALIYVLVYSSYGFYDYIYSTPLYWKLLIVYLYFAVIWPGFAYIGSRIYKFEYVLIKDPYPCDFYKSLNSTSITFKFLYTYASYLNLLVDNYALRNYHFFSTHNISFLFKSSVLRGIYDTAENAENGRPIYFKFNNFWLHEKNYTVPVVLYFSFHNIWWNCVNVEAWYREGIKLYGTKYMNKKYLKYYERHKDLVKCMFFILMDCRRLLGFGKDDFMLRIGNDRYFCNLPYKDFINSYFYAIMVNVDYNSVKIDKFVSNKIYIELFEFFIFLKLYGESFHYEFYFLKNKIKEEAIIMEMPVECFLKEEEDVFIQRLFDYVNDIEKEYLNSFSMLKSNDTNVLISTSVVKEFEKKWGKEFLKTPKLYDNDKEDPYDYSNYL